MYGWEAMLIVRWMYEREVGQAIVRGHVQFQGYLGTGCVTVVARDGRASGLSPHAYLTAAVHVATRSWSVTFIRDARTGGDWRLLGCPSRTFRG